MRNQQKFIMILMLILNRQKNYTSNKNSVLAYPLFEKLYFDNARQSNIPISVQTEAKYYAIVCRLQLNDITAVNDAIDFITLEHNAPRIEMMCYQLR